MIEFRTSLQFTDMAQKLPVMEKILQSINPGLKIHNQFLRTRSLIWIPFESCTEYELFVAELKKKEITLEVDLIAH